MKLFQDRKINGEREGEYGEPKAYSCKTANGDLKRSSKRLFCASFKRESRWPREARICTNEKTDPVLHLFKPINTAAIACRKCTVISLLCKCNNAHLSWAPPPYETQQYTTLEYSSFSWNPDSFNRLWLDFSFIPTVANFVSFRCRKTTSFIQCLFLGTALQENALTFILKLQKKNSSFSQKEAISLVYHPCFHKHRTSNIYNDDHVLQRSDGTCHQAQNSLKNWRLFALLSIMNGIFKPIMIISCNTHSSPIDNSTTIL